MLGRLSALTILCLLLPSIAYVIWVSEDFDPRESQPLHVRDAGVCGGSASLTQCGSSFPSNFCCPQTSICLSLNTTTVTKAVLCCPAGADCSAIAPITCDAPNNTADPGNLFHADAAVQLQSCGAACCPLGYVCQGNVCRALPGTEAVVTSPSASNSASSTTIKPTSSSNASTLPTGPASTTVAAAPTATNLVPVAGIAQAANPRASFSGSSFAAGLVPGVVLGAIIAACLLLFCISRRSWTRDSYTEEKAHRDTLTALSPLHPRPTMHGRSISEPTADPHVGYRTDFIRASPPREPDLGHIVEIRGPVTPMRTPKATKPLFSRSPFLTQTPSTPPSTQPPLPAHLKRGTLSFHTSPLHRLRKQKSMHSLRRHITDVGTSRSNSRRTAGRPAGSRTGSTETIRILIDTPDQRADHLGPAGFVGCRPYQPPSSASTWYTTASSGISPVAEGPSRSTESPVSQDASSSRYPAQVSTPAREPMHLRGEEPPDEGLGTPYTPSRYHGGGQGKATDAFNSDGGLRVAREPDKRNTTFSAMMEKAGWRKSEVMGKQRAW